MQKRSIQLKQVKNGSGYSRDLDAGRRLASAHDAIGIDVDHERMRRVPVQDQVAYGKMRRILQ